MSPVPTSGNVRQPIISRRRCSRSHGGGDSKIPLGQDFQLTGITIGTCDRKPSVKLQTSLVRPLRRRGVTPVNRSCCRGNRHSSPNNRSGLPSPSGSLRHRRPSAQQSCLQLKHLFRANAQPARHQSTGAIAGHVLGCASRAPFGGRDDNENSS